MSFLVNSIKKDHQHFAMASFKVFRPRVSLALMISRDGYFGVKEPHPPCFRY